MKALLALLVFLLLASAASADPRISSLRVTLDGERVLADLSLEGALDGKLRRRIESGLPTSILYRFELHRDRKRWYDRRLEDNTLEATAVYDAVARTYTFHLRLGDKLIESRMVKDRQALEDAMTHIQGLPIFTLAPVEGRPRLLVKVRAELGSRMILSIIPGTLATDWVESAKFRPPRRP
jgi:hypothetical protein